MNFLKKPHSVHREWRLMTENALKMCSLHRELPSIQSSDCHVDYMPFQACVFVEGFKVNLRKLQSILLKILLVVIFVYS